MSDETRPIHPIAPIGKPDPTGLGDINWPKAFVIVAVTLILMIGLVTVVALVALPGEFWLQP